LKNVSTPWADITDFLDSVPPAASRAKAPEEQYYAHAAADHGSTPGTSPTTTSSATRARPPSGPGPGSDLQLHHGAPRLAGPFTFTAFGDQGVTYDAVATSNLILAQSPAFHLHAGDVSYAENGGTGS
jgi:hypothetical protein